MRVGSGRLSPTAVLLAGVAVCMLAAFLLPRSAAAAITFTRSSVVTGDGPTTGVLRHLAVGDFNGDGDADLVTPTGNSSNVSVLLGQAGGGFSARQEVTTGGAPFAVAVADVNGDGDLDVAVTRPSVAGPIENDVSVLLGRGDGSFDPLSPRPGVGDQPISIVVGDFNRDGDPDLVTANGGSDDVSVLLGQAGGGCGPKRDIPVGDLPASVAVGDFNRDGDPDLATANNSSDSVSVLLGRDGGDFGSKQDFTTGRQPRSVAVGDSTVTTTRTWRSPTKDRATCRYCTGNPETATSASSRTSWSASFPSR